MTDVQSEVRKPLHMVWDPAIVMQMAVANPEWGGLPCPLDGQRNFEHRWIRHEVSYNDLGEMDGLRTVACNLTPGPKQRPTSAAEPVDATGEPVDEAPDTGQNAEDTEDLRGCMRDGYTPEDVNRVFARLESVFGVRLVCVWNYVDALGFGGNSQFYVEHGGRTFELAGDLWRWLNRPPGAADAPATPGHPSSWLGAAVPLTFDYEDWGHNYAARDER
ncbi:hypothetical protein [Streptomyces albogriseolus]|uniref:hypothetical protein n=1 Tax=Streptomyces albogriseolus TaxID=1887 RepID=UPI003461609B